MAKYIIVDDCQFGYITKLGKKIKKKVIKVTKKIVFLGEGVTKLCLLVTILRFP